jgi:hypothetical protein
VKRDRLARYARSRCGRAHRRVPRPICSQTSFRSAAVLAAIRTGHLLSAESKPPRVTDCQIVRLVRELLDGQGSKAEISTEVEVGDDASRLICRESFVWTLRRGRT